MACADIYTALKLTGQEFTWIAKDDQKNGFRFDRAFEMFGKQFFLELETGSHFYRNEQVIPDKVTRYMKLEGWFHVIFVTMDYDPAVTATRNAEDLIRLLSVYGRNTQFLITTHEAFLVDPLDYCLLDPRQNPHSLATLPLES